MDFKNYIRAGIGASDITPLLLNGNVFFELIDRFTEVFATEQVDKIACIEGRGFILGSALAYKLKVGLIPLRIKGKLKDKVYSLSFKDYSGQKRSLEMHKDAVNGGENILIVDDWVQTGETLKAAIKLIELEKGRIVGVGVLMDDSTEELKQELKKYNYKFIEKYSPEDNF